ncbi:MAG: choline-sulfatase [Spirochaetaceae bacterium]|nr:MAG: choline-sulfatase [Spirochaetaceae bacterium]
MKKPNILMILADQMATDPLPFYSDRGPAKVPQLSSLAENGVVFVNAYCNSPLCAPARACLSTGLRSSRNGVYDNGAELSSAVPTFVHLLRLAGYSTTLSGKAHFIGPDQLHGFERRLTTDIYPSDFRWMGDWDNEMQHGVGTSVEKLKISGVCRTNNQLLYDEEAQFRALEYLRYQALEKNKDPFFLCVSYTHPHESFQTTQKYWDMHTDAEAGMPEIPDPGIEGQHPYNRWLQVHHGVTRYTPTEEVVRASRRAYLGMISYVDTLVGQLIAELKHLGLYEDTIVIFSSDHGEMLGEHGMWYKRTYYEESLRVPLIFSWPKRFTPAVREELVSLVDLFATILDLAGSVEIETLRNGLDGDSLLPLLQGNGAGWKNQVLFEYLGGGVRTPMLGVRKGNWKYVCFHELPSLLFDLDKDGHELDNLAENQQLAGKVQELHSLAVGQTDVAGLRNRIIYSQKQRQLVQKALHTGEYVPWDYQPQFDASKQYVRERNLPVFC